MTISEADRERLQRRLERMPLERDALRLAMQQFGTDFDAGAWRAAFQAQDPAALNQVLPVTGNFRALVDNMVELEREAVTLIGLKPAGRRLSTNSDVEAVRADGGLTGQQSYDLIQLKLLSDQLRHVYIDTNPDDVHEAVTLVLDLLPGFTKAYVRWLGQYGIVLTGGGPTR